MHSEISKCTQECLQELPEQGACESRVQGYRNKEICKNLQGLCNELQGSPDCLIYFGEGAINRLLLSGGIFDSSPDRHLTKNRLTSMQTGRLRSSLDLTVNLCENFHEFMP